jgi:glycosyltransferase involved in cell wall biosynthesis
MNILRIVSDHKEHIAGLVVIQKLYLVFSLLKYIYAMRLKRDSYAAYAATLGYERVAATIRGWRVSPFVHQLNSNLVDSIKNSARGNPLVESYVMSPQANRYREEFRTYGWEHQVRLKYPRERDDPSRQGDLLILKPYIGSREKGVLLIQYNDAFHKFASIYDMKLAGQYYRIVLEPSTWGYRSPEILFFVGLPTDVIVQAQYGADFLYIESLAANLVPLRMGAGDWIDEDRFQPLPYAEKIYDIVMVASWQRIKRHELLFDAVQKCGEKLNKVALIGYPSSGRTKKDILREATKHRVERKIDIFESIPRADVSKIIRQSKIGVMLTLREGANKGIYECLFSGVPVVISERNIGVNREHINQYTGVAASDDDLPGKLGTLLDKIHEYAPREWALKATGYKNSTLLLNECLKRCALGHGEEWTRDIYAKKNDTNARYARVNDQEAADRAIAHLRNLLRT